MAKMVKTNDDNGQEVARYEAPERVAPSLPANAIRLADLCNGGDIVIRGPGKAFDTEHGSATPVFYQESEEYQATGAVELDMMFDENGSPFFTGKPSNQRDLTDDDVPRGVFQFITSSVVILRAAKQAIKDFPDRGMTCRVVTKRSVSTGRDYYILE